MDKKSVKNWFISFSLGLIFVVSVFSNHCLAQTESDYLNYSSSYDFVIDEFNADITVNETSDITVQEKITANFFVQKHGIYRYIPVRYKTKSGNNLTLKCDFKGVTDENGNNIPYEITSGWDNKEIKIGDPDKTVTGLQTYIITYNVQRAINYFDDHDELYWNVTGTGWEEPILKVKATVNVPGVSKNDLRAETYLGEYGSKAQSQDYEISDGKITYEANTFLTIVAGWPKGITKEPEFGQKTIWFIQDNFSIALPFIVLASLIILWLKRGRDPEGRETITVQYDSPDNITPAELGVLIDERANLKDISATMIDLAVRGFIKIKEIPKKGVFSKKDYEFTLLKKDFTKDKSLKDYETRILNAMFETTDTKKLSGMQEGFAKELSEIKKELYQSVVKRGYFPASPDLIRNIYLGIGIIVAAAGGIVGPIFSPMLAISVFISGFIVVIFSFFMPRKTSKGVLAKEHALGLKEYLKTAEKHRIKFEEKEKIFEKFLPYAMVFGVAALWAKAFEEIYKNPPDWYEGNIAAFSAANFTSSLEGMSSSVNNTVMTSASSGGSGFGGGGFSGGGGGGGGGGGW